MRWDWIMARAEWFTFQSAGNVYSGSWWQGSTKAAVIMSLTQFYLTNEWRHRDLPWPRWDVQYHSPNVRWDFAVKFQKLFSGSVFLCNFNLFSFINSISHAHSLLSVYTSVWECYELWPHVFYNHRWTNRFLCFHVSMFAVENRFLLLKDRGKVCGYC